MVEGETETLGGSKSQPGTCPLSHHPLSQGGARVLSAAMAWKVWYEFSGSTWGPALCLFSAYVGGPQTSAQHTVGAQRTHGERTDRQPRASVTAGGWRATAAASEAGGWRTQSVAELLRDEPETGRELVPTQEPLEYKNADHSITEGR